MNLRMCSTNLRWSSEKPSQRTTPMFLPTTHLLNDVGTSLSTPNLDLSLTNWFFCPNPSNHFKHVAFFLSCSTPTDPFLAPLSFCTPHQHCNLTSTSVPLPLCILSHHNTSKQDNCRHRLNKRTPLSLVDATVTPCPQRSLTE